MQVKSIEYDAAGNCIRYSGKNCEDAAFMQPECDSLNFRMHVFRVFLAIAEVGFPAAFERSQMIAASGCAQRAPFRPPAA